MKFNSRDTFLMLFIGISLVQPLYADEFDRAQQLLKENQPEQAYQFLMTEETDHIGEPEYDLLLARTALAADHPHEAIFAFERVLIHNPANLVARVEMAIAYYRIDELENAQQHLHIVLQSNPQGEIRNTLNQYLAIISKKISARRNVLSGSHTFRQGWDSNINSATNESEIHLTIGTYRPTEGVDKETADSYSELLNHLTYQHHFNVNTGLYSGVVYNIRENNNRPFDTQTAEVKLGLEQSTSIGKFSIPVSYQAIWLDDQQLRYVTSLGGSLSQQSAPLYANYAIQYSEIRYPDQSPLNVDQVLVSVVAGRQDKKARLNPQYAIFYGDETATDSLYRFNARCYKGGQIRLPTRIASRHYLVPRLVYQQAEYKAQHPFFLALREDEHVSASLDWNWYLDHQWRVNGQLSHSRNESSVDLYSYERNIVSFGITYKY